MELIIYLELTIFNIVSMAVVVGINAYFIFIENLESTSLKILSCLVTLLVAFTEIIIIFEIIKN